MVWNAILSTLEIFWRGTKWNHLWLGWGEWELVLERSQGFRGKLLLQMLTPQFPLPDCGPLKGQKSYLTYLVSNDTQQSTGGKWDVWPNNEPRVLSP